MQNQYFGDINDYFKYGLIRALAAPLEAALLVNWMLVADDGGDDGAKTAYLRAPSKWRGYDSDVFDALRQSVIEDDRRDVHVLEEAGLLERGTFEYSPIDQSRQAWWRASVEGVEALDATRPRLVFFDPDNGLEVQKQSMQRAGPHKFLRFVECDHAFGSGASVLIYQHIRQRAKREEYFDHKCGQVFGNTGAKEVFFFFAGSVSFLLLPQPDHRQHLVEAATAVKGRWKSAGLRCAQYAAAE